MAAAQKEGCSMDAPMPSVTHPDNRQGLCGVAGGEGSMGEE